MRFLLVPLFGVCLTVLRTECRYLQDEQVHVSKFHGEGVVTYWPTPKPTAPEKIVVDDENQPGFMRRQLLRFGEMASNIGNTMGAHASKITSAIDKICEVVKTVIPVIAAVCHVGQFRFCSASTDGPQQLAQAMNPVDLNIPD